MVILAHINGSASEPITNLYPYCGAFSLVGWVTFVSASLISDILNVTIMQTNSTVVPTGAEGGSLLLTQELTQQADPLHLHGGGG